MFLITHVTCPFLHFGFLLWIPCSFVLMSCSHRINYQQIGCPVVTGSAVSKQLISVNCGREVARCHLLRWCSQSWDALKLRKYVYFVILEACGSRTVRVGPQEPPRKPQELPRSTQVLPRSTQDPPRIPQERPRNTQEPPRSSQELTRSSQGGPKSSQGPPQEHVDISLNRR